MKSYHLQDRGKLAVSNYRLWRTFHPFNSSHPFTPLAIYSCYTKLSNVRRVNTPRVLSPKQMALNLAQFFDEESTKTGEICFSPPETCATADEMRDAG